MGDYTAGKPWKLAKRQHIMGAAYALFSQKGIERVTMPEIAEAGGVGRATLYRYFATKLDLVVAIGTWQWAEYIKDHDVSLPQETIDQMSGAEYLGFYLDAFVDLYRNHKDILRFNYNFNSFLSYEVGTSEQRQPYMHMVDGLLAAFHGIYERGLRDGTLDTAISEASMFSSSFHIMLAAATRYAVGLVYLSPGADPESELVMLKELLLAKYTRVPDAQDGPLADTDVAGA